MGRTAYVSNMINKILSEIESPFFNNYEVYDRDRKRLNELYAAFYDAIEKNNKEDIDKCHALIISYKKVMFERVIEGKIRMKIHENLGKLRIDLLNSGYEQEEFDKWMNSEEFNDLNYKPISEDDNKYKNLSIDVEPL